MDTLAELNAALQEVLVDITDDDKDMLKTIVNNVLKMTASDNFPYLGSILPRRACKDAPLTKNSHWYTWRIRGHHCILIQAKRRKKRKANDSDIPYLYVMFEDGMCKRFKHNNIYFCNKGDNASFRTLIFEGTLALRARSVAHTDRMVNDNQELLRKDTLLSLGDPTAHIVSNEAKALGFYATSCIWSRVYTGIHPLTERLQQARAFICGCAPTIKPLLQGQTDMLHIYYVPIQMPQQPFPTDVPDILRGLELEGIEFRVGEATHTFGMHATDFYITGTNIELANTMLKLHPD